MPLLSRIELLFSAFAGGLLGIVVTVAISLTLHDKVVSPMEVTVGAFIGFALLSAIMMIKNSAPRRGSD